VLKEEGSVGCGAGEDGEWVMGWRSIGGGCCEGVEVE
jgi:hypothetical protein